jgi:hypothetical protein
VQDDGVHLDLLDPVLNQQEIVIGPRAIDPSIHVGSAGVQAV